MRSSGRSRAPRILAALLAAIPLLLAAPRGALAAENLWAQWWEGCTDRSTKAEIPIAVVVTIPAMILITPIWLAQMAIGRLSSGDEHGASGDEEGSSGDEDESSRDVDPS
jgi:hypothetical protein